MTRTEKIIISIVITIAIFVLDVSTSREYATWALFVIPLLIASSAVTRRTLPFFPLGGTILIVFDFLLSPGEITTIAVVNRALGVLVLWAALPLLIRQKRAEEALERSYREMEQQVAERTAELERVNASLKAEIGERKQAEENLRKTMEELSRSNKDLEQFGYAVSHDLQEPLRTVSGYMRLLADKYKGRLDAKADKYIDFSVEGTLRMSTLISDLLAYSRVGTRGKQFAHAEMDAVFKKTVRNLQKAIDESGAIVTCGGLPEVFGDETQLVQLLQNLIGNAVKFRKKDVRPEIHLSAEYKANEWVFVVRDNGIGIDPVFHGKIFEIFQRLHTRTEYSGTGVGLAISRRIVERHGGRIWVESEPGAGTSFFFTIPDHAAARHEETMKKDHDRAA